jgi:hypothetical protein
MISRVKRNSSPEKKKETAKVLAVSPEVVTVDAR